MDRKQLLTLAGMAAATVVCLTAIWLAARQPLAGPPQSAASALVLAVRWLLAPGFCLFAGIGVTANRRFFSPEAIDGGRPAADHFLEINLRYNQNTLEQTVLAAIAWTGLAVAVPERSAALIPVLAGLFVAGRLSFWIGYLMAPWARAFGLALTFYPTAGTLVWLGIRAIG